MKDYTQDELNDFWNNIQDGKYHDYPAESKPVDKSSEGVDRMSIPDTIYKRQIFERKNDSPWEEINNVGDDKQFE